MSDLVAFKVEGSKDTFNDWRFITKTECVEFNIKADSEENAVKIAADKLAQKEG